MKKVLTLILVVLTLVSLAIPAFAVDALGDNSTTIKVTVPGISTVKPTLDGVISDYEYQEIKYTAADMRYNAPDDATLATFKALGFKMYAAYDTNTMYIAVVVESPDYIQEKAASSMYLQWSCQVSAAKGDEATAANRSEYGFARNSSTNELMFNAWADAYKLAWAPDLTGKDFTVVTSKGYTTYEMAIPAKAFGVDSLSKGSQVRLNICVNVGSDTTKRGQIEWSQGCGGSKNATQFALVTLGDAIVVPAKPAATTTTSASTADAASYAVAALALSLAVAFAVSKKSKKA